MASAAAAAAPIIRRIPPPRVYASIHRRRSTTETRQSLVYDNDQDHEKCLIEANELRELNRRQLLRIQLLECDYRQLDDEMVQMQNERGVLLNQKRTLEEELARSSHHASANVDLHVYTQSLEKECRDLQCQLTMRDKDKLELNDIIADFEVQIKQARDRQEEWRDAYNEVEVMLSTETEQRQCFEIQLREAHARQKENENQVRRLQNDLDEAILTKQEIVKSNYALVQNAESLREQLRTVRTHAAEVRIICPSSSTSFDNLDESIPCLAYDDDDDTPDCENHPHSSLFSEINSLETMSNEAVQTCLNGTANDIELDLLLAKTTTLSSSLSLINQLINEMKTLQKVLFEQQTNGELEQEHQRLATMQTLLKRVLENTQVFDTRFRKLQLLLIASREQQQCHQAELEDFFRLVDKRLVPDVEQSTDNGANTRPRLASILEVYDQELDRLRQIIRTNDDTIRSCERQLAGEQSASSRWRMKSTFLEKNQRKLLEKLKESNSERRQLIESSAHKRTRRRAAPTIHVELQPKKLPVILSPTPSEPVISHRLSRSHSLPHLKSTDHGRKSRNDSGVVLTDDISHYQPLPLVYNRRRIKYNTTNQVVMHTSSHVCYQKTNNSMNCHSKHSQRRSCRFQWFFLFLLIISVLFSLMKFLFLS